MHWKISYYCQIGWSVTTRYPIQRRGSWVERYRKYRYIYIYIYGTGIWSKSLSCVLYAIDILIVMFSTAHAYFQQIPVYGYEKPQKFIEEYTYRTNDEIKLLIVQFIEK